jgi:hypothetical protein
MDNYYKPEKIKNIMKQLINDNYGKPSGENQGHFPINLQTNHNNIVYHPKWQRVTLQIVLGYEGAGALLGGSLLVASLLAWPLSTAFNQIFKLGKEQNSF